MILFQHMPKVSFYAVYCQKISILRKSGKYHMNFVLPIFSFLQIGIPTYVLVPQDT